MNKGDFKLPLHPNSLSVAAKTVLTVIATFLMTLCGVWNMLGIAANNGTVLMLTGMLSMLVYFIVGGICALLVLEAPRLAGVPPIISFVFIMAFFGIMNGGFRVAFLADALMSLFPAVGGAILAIAMKRGAKRSGAILASSMGTGIFAALVLILSVYLAGGVIDGESLISVVDQARVNLIESFEAQLEILKTELPDYDLSSLDVEGTVNGVFNMLPAMLVLVFNAIAFFSNLSLLALLRILDLYHKLERSDIEFKVSPVTAGVFAVSYIMAVVLAASDNVALAVFDNLSMILMPALAVVGLMDSLPRKDGNTVRVGCFPLILSGVLMMFFPSLGVLVLAIFGTFYTLRAAWMNVKNKKEDNK